MLITFLESSVQAGGLFKRLTTAVFLGVVVLGVMGVGVPWASAATPGPGWSIDSVAEPTSFSSADTRDEVRYFAVLATGGTYKLLLNEGEAASSLSRAIPWNASAQELQQALEAVPDVGAGNVLVSGGPGDETGSHPYRVEYVSALSGEEEYLSESQSTLTGGAHEVHREFEKNVEPAAKDRYALVVTNVGARSSEGTVTVTDTLPPGLVATELQIELQGPGEKGKCSLAERKCTFEGPVPAGHELIMHVSVAVTSPSLRGPFTNRVSVFGGGGAEVSGSQSNPVNAAPASFGIAHLGFQAFGPAGAPDAQAGDHPYAVTTTVDLNTVLSTGGQVGKYEVARVPKAISVELPLGFLGDPLATSRCPELDLTFFEGDPNRSNHTHCSPATQVGTFSYRSDGGNWSGRFPVYNVVPERGYPAEFGLNAGLGQPIFLYPTLIPGSSGYRLRVGSTGILNVTANTVKTDIEAFSFTIFGNPAERDGVSGDAAFLTSPMLCTAEPLTVSAEATAWEGGSGSAEATAYPQLTGCGLFQGIAGFDPGIAVKPETSQSAAPVGYGVDVRLPQAPNVFGGLATPYLRDATVALPLGVAVNPSSAGGLRGCPEGGPEGIDLEGPGAIEVGEGHPGGNGSPYDDGLVHGAPGHCPAASTLGSVEARTPILSEPLVGHVYLGEPGCSPCTAGDAQAGRMIRLYMELAGSGVVVKQAGSVSVDPVTGQLTGSFRGIPQAPLEDVKIHFKGGPRAALVNPQACGVYTATSDLRPWSAPESGADATPSGSFGIDEGCSAPGFAPSFTAGTVDNQAGAFSAFSVVFSRQDGEQGLGAVSVTTPPGLLGLLKSVQLCGEPQASQGACGGGSLIGHTSATVGAGPDPFNVGGGEVFLTGPYKGAPFGLSIVVPAVAGPFDLGSVVVRAAVSVDPHTAQVTVVSDPLPTILDGIPLRVRAVNVTVDRPGFLFNPTSCEPLSVAGTLASTQGTTAGVSSRFQAANCATLPFHPVFSVSTQARTSKKEGASLDVRTTFPAGVQANIRSVAVTLPRQLPARLTTIQQACPGAVFAQNPAGCPAGSVIGMGRASTPVLANSVVGPAYLVSHGGAAFPDVVVVLQGEGVTLDLVGSIDIKHGVTSSTFAGIPDAPVSGFELSLPEGPHSGLAAVVPAKAKASLCGQSLAMPFTITGQNGAVIKQNTRISVAGCPKAKKAKKKRAKHGRAKAKRGKKK